MAFYRQPAPALDKTYWDFRLSMAKASPFDFPGRMPSLSCSLFSGYFINTLSVPHTQGYTDGNAIRTNTSGWNSTLSSRLVPWFWRMASYWRMEGDEWISSE